MRVGSTRPWRPAGRVSLDPLALLMLVGLATAACTSTAGGGGGSWDVCTLSQAISNPDGGLHGAPCTGPQDCQYGICATNGIQLPGGATVGVCTKDCSCGAGSQCSNDDVSGTSFTCVKALAGAGSECAIRCSGDDVCTAMNPALRCASPGEYGQYLQSAATGICMQLP